MKKIWVVSFVLFVVGSCFGMDSPRRALIHAAQHGAEGMLTLRVLDDEGRPVNAADIWANFPKPLFNQGATSWITDTNGFCMLRGIATDDIVYSINKSGYYETRGSYAFSQQKMPMVIDGKWQPWNPTNTVILKPIKNPVSMYVRKMKVKFPVEDEPVGFDLEKADWVQPYGKGIVSDFIFTFSREQKDGKNYDASLKIDFSEEGDGLQVIHVPSKGESLLRLPYIAPEFGYEANLLRSMGYDSGRGYFGFEKPDSDVNYIFRVRTVLDENGNVKEACYGKIHGAFLMGGTQRPVVTMSFTYYYNPDGTQNLEFDTKRNLFPGVKINQP